MVFYGATLTPLVIALTFILVGYSIAPRYKYITSMVLSGVYVAGLVALIAFMSDTFHLELRGILALIGAVGSFCVGWVKAKEERKRGKDEEGGWHYFVRRKAKKSLDQIADEQAQATVDGLNSPAALEMWERQDREIAEFAKKELERRKRAAGER